jgi:hypothetical protein
LFSLGHAGGAELDFDASFWLTRYHARAFWDGDRTRAWDRISELQGSRRDVLKRSNGSPSDSRQATKNVVTCHPTSHDALYLLPGATERIGLY